MSLLFLNLLYNYNEVLKMNNLIEYIILGLVQGLTEPLPISSSGHMLIF